MDYDRLWSFMMHPDRSKNAVVNVQSSRFAEIKKCNFNFTPSIVSKSSLKSQSSRRDLISLIDERLSKKNSALPSGISGLAICASRILAFSSSVGNMVRSFSMPSLLMMVLSILMMAVLMTRGGGRAVMPIMIMLERLASRIVISFLPSPDFYDLRRIHYY